MLNMKCDDSHPFRDTDVRIRRFATVIQSFHSTQCILYNFRSTKQHSPETIYMSSSTPCDQFHRCWRPSGSSMPRFDCELPRLSLAYVTFCLLACVCAIMVCLRSMTSLFPLAFSTSSHTSKNRIKSRVTSSPTNPTPRALCRQVFATLARSLNSFLHLSAKNHRIGHSITSRSILIDANASGIQSADCATSTYSYTPTARYVRYYAPD